VGVLDLDWRHLAAQFSPRQAAPFEDLLAGWAAAGPAARPAYLVVLMDTPPLERQSALVGFVQQQLAKLMGVADPQQIDPTEPLFNMGLDSLMALELTVLLEANLGVRLTESLVFEHPTIEELARYFLQDVLFPEESSPISGLEAAPPSQEPDSPGSTTAAAGGWDQQVADVAALDTADLLRQLRGD
jgi:acyl carrier protein